MILINRNLLIVLAVIVISVSLGAGWFGYQQIIGSSGLSEEEIRFQAESFLFYFISTGIVLTCGFILLFARVRHVDRQLDKLIEMSRYSDIYPAKHFVGLGPLGERLKLLYRHINKLNIRKTMKISALSNLNDFLLNNISLPLVVTDVTGIILYSNVAFADKFNSTRGDLKSSRIDLVFTELNIQVLMLELSRQHVPVEKESNQTQITCYPVHNVSAEMNYVVFVPDKKAAYTITHKTGVEAVSKGNSVPGLFERIFSGRKN
jgi:PAS domain-containing protein